MNVIFDLGQYWVKKIWLLTLLLACTITIVKAQDPTDELVPFDCSQNGYIVGNNSLYAVNMKTGASRLIAALPNSPAGQTKTSYNAMGYCSIDNCLWATTGYGYLAKIDQNGRVQFFNVPGLPNTVNAGNGHETSDYAAFICGSFDMNGTLYLYNGNARYYYMVNVSSGTPVYTGKAQLGNGNGYSIADWILDNNTNTLQAVDLGSPSRKYVFNAATGALAAPPITINQGTSGLNAENSSGSIFTDVSGTTYVYGNTTGGFYRINNTAPYTASKITTLSVFQNNDGTNCPCVSLGSLGFANSVKDITFCSESVFAIDMFVFGTGTQNILRVFKDGSIYKDNVIATPDTTVVSGLNEPGVYTAVVWAGNCNGWVPINDTLIIRTKSCAKLSLAKTVNKQNVKAGDEVIFTLSASNNGTTDTTDVLIKDFPTGFTYVGDNSAGAFNSTSMVWNASTIQAGTTNSIQVTMTANASGPYNNIIVDNSGDGSDTAKAQFAALSITKTANKQNVKTGDQVIFTLSASNNGTADTTGVLIKDFPTGFTYVSDNSAGAFNSTSMIWNAGTIQAGGTNSIQVTMSANASGPYGNIIVDNSGNGTDTAKAQFAALSIAKTANKQNVKTGDEVIFTLSASNNGTADTTGVLIKDFPTGFTYVSDNSAGAFNSTSMIWNAGTIQAGTTNSIQVTMTANASGPYGNIIVDNSGDGSDTASAKIQSYTAVKSVSDASGDGVAQAGEVLTYTIKVRNIGSVSLTPINIIDTIPANTSYIDGGSYNASNNVVSFSDDAPLEADSIRSYSFRVQVASDVTGINVISNQATAIVDTIPSTPTKPADPSNPDIPDPSCTDPAGCTTDIPVQGVKSFITWKSVSDANGDRKAQAGEQLSYTIKVKNTGTAQLNNIAVSDIVPAHTSYVSGGTYNKGNNTVSFSGINLAIGATASYSFVVQVTNDLTGISSISNKATVVADTIPSTPTKPADPSDPGSPDPSCTDPAGCTTDISVQGVKSFITWKSVSDASGDRKAQAGEELTYTIKVKNTGTVQLNNIAVSDVVPAHTSYVSGGTYNAGTNTVSFNGINLAVGATDSYSFVVRVMNDLTGFNKVSNQATVVVDTIPSTPTKPADPSNPGNPDPSCTDPAGCTTDIPVQGNLHIPNVITPNGDGYNDKFVIQGTDYDQLQVTIFNRWNNVVYQNSMYQNDWDGNGLNASTYFYVVKALNKTSHQWEVYKGWLSLMR